MDRATLEITVEELKKVVGGYSAEASHEQVFHSMKLFVEAAIRHKCSYEETLSMAIFAYGDDLTEAEIDAYIRSAYGII